MTNDDKSDDFLRINSLLLLVIIVHVTALNLH